MKLKTVLLKIILSTIFITSVSAQMQYEDFSISHKSIGSSCMSTIDLRITEEIGKQSDYLIDYDYGNIRKDGVLMSVYYSNLLAKAQWNDFPSPHGIILMPTNLYLPIDKWIESGVKANGSWWIRIVILNPISCPT
jgi:hypothetical protein